MEFKKVFPIFFALILTCYAGAPSYKPVPIRPCLDYVKGGTTAAKKWSDVANRILDETNNRFAQANETNWALPKADYIAAMTVIRDDAIEQIKAGYWRACNDMADVFKDDPYHIYDLFENIAALPRPYNCIKAICESVYNTRKTTLDQVDITRMIYVDFYDEFYGSA